MSAASVATGAAAGTAIAPGVGTLIGAGLGLVTDVFNNSETQKNNQANRDFALQMYNLQRQDALSDWNMQNVYNSPAAQMQRYRDAGLNPNLIYGQSNTTDPVRSSSASVPQGEASHFTNPADNAAKGLELLGSQLQLKQTAANIENTQANTRVAQAQADKVVADTDVSRNSLDLGEQQYDIHRLEYAYLVATLPNRVDLASADLSVAQERAKQMASQTVATVDANARAWEVQGLTVRQALLNLTSTLLSQAKTQQETDNLKATYDNIKADTNNKVLDNSLKGVQLHDSRMGLTGSSGELLLKQFDRIFQGDKNLQ